ncbi:MAG: hypothetical protein ABMA25_14905 [Ilumatobacteraceae bacterium]
MPTLTIDFAGEVHELDGSTAFVIGRDGDLQVDENPYLHRRFLEVRFEHNLWWLANIGGQLTATVSDSTSGVHAWLAPGGRMPIVFGATCVRFTAGPTSYEIDMTLSDAPYMSEETEEPNDGSTTIGRVMLTHDQKRMLVALAEAALRRGAPGAVELPSSGQAAERLGWTLKKFEKKIDNVCDKLANKGVRGLKGGQGNLASGRRARLVEYALAARIVTAADLPILDAPVASRGDELGDDAGDE